MLKRTLITLCVMSTLCFCAERSFTENLSAERKVEAAASAAVPGNSGNHPFLQRSVVLPQEEPYEKYVPGDCEQVIDLTAIKHADPGNCACRLMPDGSGLVVIEKNGLIRKLSMDGTPRDQVQGNTYSHLPRISSDSQLMASYQGFASPRGIRLYSLAALSKTKPQICNFDCPQDYRFCKQGKELVVAGKETIALYDVTSNKFIWSLLQSAPKYPTSIVAATADGSQFAAATQENNFEITLFDYRSTGRHTHKVGKWIQDILFLPNNNLAIASGKQIQQLDLRTQKVVTTFKCGSGNYRESLVTSEQGNLVAALTAKGVVGHSSNTISALEVWDLATQSQEPCVTAEFIGTSTGGRSVDITNDGKKLLAALYHCQYNEKEYLRAHLFSLDEARKKRTALAENHGAGAGSKEIA